MKKSTFLLLFSCACSALFSQQIWYVNAAAIGANNGLDWQHAFVDLQAALQAAAYGDDIWVSAGTYKPTADSNRMMTFDLPVGVRLAGGFAGTETSFGERDWENNITILSGDIGAAGVSEDNSYHVVRIYGGDTLTVLDGFKIMHGRSGGLNDPTPQAYGGGVLVWADPLRPVSIPLIQNCTIEQNYATTGGGIACVSQYDEHTPAPDIKNCLFRLNKGEYQGGAFCKKGRCVEGRPFKFENCVFRENYCTQSGGAMAILLATGQVIFKNCAFLSDSTSAEAGALYIESHNNVRYLIDSCQFSFNYARNGDGGAISHFQFADTVTIELKNSLFSYNRSRANVGACLLSGVISGSKQNLFVQNCNFENNYALNGGAGIYVEGSGYCVVDIQIDRCLFYKNLYSNTNTGGGAFFYRSFGTQFVQNYNRITNSVFVENDGAIVTLGPNPGTLETDIINCTFLNNDYVPFIKFWSPDFNTSDYFQKMRILNSIIWEEESPGPHRTFYNNDPDNFNVNDYIVEHCLINLPSCEYEGVDPCGVGMIYETDPQFISEDPAAPDLALSPATPAINRGSNTAVDSFNLLYDYLGNPRIRQDTVDIGAYEMDVVSGIHDPFLEKESFMLQVQPSLLSAGDNIQVHVFNLGTEKALVVSLKDLYGKVYDSQVLNRVPQQGTVSCRIPGDQLPAGIYFISVQDGQGIQKTRKLMKL